MIEVRNLSKSYGAVQALSDVSFNIADGEIVGLLGHNGAGKTTIIKTLTGYLQPDEGDVRVGGLDVLTETQDVQAQIGYLPENAPLYHELSVQSYLQMMAGLREIEPENELQYLSDAVHSAGLAQHLIRPIGQLSKGFRQRVGLAQAILHKPKLLILDEPTVGLDPTQIIEIRNLIRRLSKHSTILFSTHILSEVEALCDRVIIIFNGRIQADARLDELTDKNETILLLSESVDGVAETLRGIEGVRDVAVADGEDGVEVRISAEKHVDLGPTVFQVAAANNWPVRELRNEVQTLESVFRALQEDFEDVEIEEVVSE